MKTYYVYIVASRSRVLYLGVTNELNRRMAEHKAKQFSGFSAQYNCNRVVWYESFVDVNEAIETEKRVKGWRREKKVALIAQTNPAWTDLSIASEATTHTDPEIPRVTT